MNVKKLMLELYNAESSEAVYQIVDKYGLNGPANWKPYGGNTNNAGTFENQQSSSENALVEKLTNGIDSLLTLECRRRGMDPEDRSNSSVPQDIPSAIRDFYNVQEGKWANATEMERRKISTNLQVVVSGDLKTPNVAVFDKGEGQNPADFENTFLSIARGNKNKIPFVQGKYNFGATGAVVFCGERHRYQMIISRRNMDLSDANGMIGFTLVRRHILTAEEENVYKLTWYEYLVIDDKIPSIADKAVDLGLFKGESFVSGSVVKMYSYQLSKSSNATLDLWRNLNILMYEPAIPLLILEQRAFKGNSPDKLMLGNKNRITLHFNDEEKVGAMFTHELNINLFNSRIPVTVYIFPRDCDAKKQYICNNSLCFTLNGQTQGVEHCSFVSQDLGFSALRDFMYICVDCSSIGTTARQELFMASRDRMKSGSVYRELKEALIALLRDDPDIKAMNQDYKGRNFKEAGNDKELVTNMFANLQKNKSIRNLLAGTAGAYSVFQKVSKRQEPAASNSNKGEKEKNLKTHPSFLRVKDFKDSNKECVKAIRKGSQGKLSLESDVQNDFLSRSCDAGNLVIHPLDYGTGATRGKGMRNPSTDDGRKLRVHYSGPHNGEIRLIIQPCEDVQVGEIIPLSVKMISSEGEHEVVVKIRIEEEAKPVDDKDKKKPEPETTLPELIRVYREAVDASTCTWEQVRMTAADIVKFELGEKNMIERIYVNMDSNLALKYINAKKADAEAIGKRYLSLVYSHSLMIYTSLLNYYSTEDDEVGEDISKQIMDGLQKAIENLFKIHTDFLMCGDGFNI